MAATAAVTNDDSVSHLNNVIMHLCHWVEKSITARLHT